MDKSAICLQCLAKPCSCGLNITRAVLTEQLNKIADFVEEEKSRQAEIDRLRAELEMERARLDHLIDEAQRPFQGNSDDTGVWLVFDDSVMTTDEIWRRTSAEEEWLIHEVVRDAIDKAMEEE